MYRIKADNENDKDRAWEHQQRKLDEQYEKQLYERIYGKSKNKKQKVEITKEKK